MKAQDIIQKNIEDKILQKLIIDLVWSATDGGCKLKEDDFSHFEEPLYEYEVIKKHISNTSLPKAILDDVEKMKKKTPNSSEIKGMGSIKVNDVLRDISFNQALQQVQEYLKKLI